MQVINVRITQLYPLAWQAMVQHAIENNYILLQKLGGGVELTAPVITYTFYM